MVGTVSRRSGKSRGQNFFYVVAAVMSGLFAFAGFARTYYLKAWFGTPGLSFLVHLHGIVMTSWIVTFAFQAWLIFTKRRALHERVGVFGACLALAVLILGVTLSLVMARQIGTPPRLRVLLLQVVNFAVFGALAGAGIFLRRRGEYHKRLMLLATISVLSAAMLRLPVGFVERGGVVSAIALVDSCVVLCAAYDTFRFRRLHPAFAWGGLLILISHPLTLAAAATPTWMRIAKLITS